MEMSPVHVGFILALIVADVAFLGAVAVSYLRAGRSRRR
jgi:hypothetical protein